MDVLYSNHSAAIVLWQYFDDSTIRVPTTSMAVGVNYFLRDYIYIILVLCATLLVKMKTSEWHNTYIVPHRSDRCYDYD